MGPSVDELHHRPIVLNNNIYDFNFTIGESLAPPMIITPVAVRACQKFAPGDIFKVAVLGDYRSATIRIAQIPGLVENSYDSLRFSHRRIHHCTAPKRKYWFQWYGDVVEI